MSIKESQQLFSRRADNLQEVPNLQGQEISSRLYLLFCLEDFYRFDIQKKNLNEQYGEQPFG